MIWKESRVKIRDLIPVRCSKMIFPSIIQNSYEGRRGIVLGLHDNNHVEARRSSPVEVVQDESLVNKTHW